MKIVNKNLLHTYLLLTNTDLESQCKDNSIFIGKSDNQIFDDENQILY